MKMHFNTAKKITSFIKPDYHSCSLYPKINTALTPIKFRLRPSVKSMNFLIKQVLSIRIIPWIIPKMLAKEDLGTDLEEDVNMGKMYTQRCSGFLSLDSEDTSESISCIIQKVILMK